MAAFPLASDAFGDRFDLAALPLPRQALGYAVQMLDTDRLLDRRRGELLPIRTPGLDALFDSFDAAFAGARAWVEQHCPTAEEHHLAIVPAGFDAVLERPLLIYGVLCTRP